MSELVRDKLAEVRSRGQTVAAGVGLSRALAGVLAVLAGVMLVDFLIELPLALRAVVLAGGVGALGYWLWDRVVRVLLRPPGDDDVALWVERDQPELRQRLISTVQLSRESGVAGASQAMLGRLVAETEELIAPMDLADVVRLEPLLKWAGGALGGLLVFVLGLLLLGTDGRDLLLRALCVPGVEVPRKTRVDLLTDSPLIVARGDDVVLRVRARGLIPTAGEVRVEGPSGPAQTYALPRAELDAPGTPATAPAAPRLSPDEFTLTLRGVAESFTYRAYLNDGRSVEGRVTASVRPTPQKVEAFVVPPAYTRQPRQKRSTGDLTLLVGSRLELAIEASKPVRSSSPVLTGSGVGQNRAVFFGPAGPLRTFPLLRDPADPRRLTTDPKGKAPGLPVPDAATGLALILVDDDGLETKDPTVYRLDLLPDRPPTLRVIAPGPDRKEEVVTRAAQVRIGFEAVDDIAVGAVRLRYIVRPPSAADIGLAPGVTLGGGAVEGKMVGGATDTPPAPTVDDDRAAATIDLAIPRDARSVRGYYPWRLASLSAPNTASGAGLPEGTVIEWWLEALDTNDVTGPGKALSDRYLTRIGTEAQVRDALMSRLNNAFGALQDTQQSQQDLARDLGKLILEKPLEK